MCPGARCKEPSCLANYSAEQANAGFFGTPEPALLGAAFRQQRRSDGPSRWFERKAGRSAASAAVGQRRKGRPQPPPAERRAIFLCGRPHANSRWTSLRGNLAVPRPARQYRPRHILQQSQLGRRRRNTSFSPIRRSPRLPSINYRTGPDNKPAKYFPDPGQSHVSRRRDDRCNLRFAPDTGRKAAGLRIKHEIESGSGAESKVRPDSVKT